MNQDDKWLQSAFPATLIGGAVLFCLPPSAFIPNENLKLLFSLFTFPVFFLIVIFITCWRHYKNETWKKLELKPLTKEDIGPVLSAIPVFLIFTGMTALLHKFGVKPPPQHLVSFAADCPVWIFILVLFSAGVVAPIIEELAFRCVAGGFFKSVFPEEKWAYYFIPSLLFAFCHGIAWQSFQLFFFALYLQWHFSKSSATRVILMHSLFNWCSLSLLILARTGILNVT
ncbi:MAG: CPBP family intramembrane metalloprotease [Lentisphaerae bacterium]|nr:CPBP family intramembrane metalloprotease [Lentisphaerota bacterium]